MAKDPAFLFYPNDWIGGTMGMTFEEKGAYMELLMLQFNRGHMTEHMIQLTVGQLWVNVKDKFIQDEKGLWYNERLEVEKEKRAKFTESRRNNVSGQNQHTKKTIHKNGHMTTHMEDRNENINESVIQQDRGMGKGKKELTQTEINQTIEFCFLTQQRKYDAVRIGELWRGFLIATENEFYPTHSKQLSHFRNWIKNQPYETNKRNTTDQAKLGNTRTAI